MKSNPVVEVLFFEDNGWKYTIVRRVSSSNTYRRDYSISYFEAFDKIVDIVNKDNWNKNIVPRDSFHKLTTVCTPKINVPVLKQGDKIIVEGEELIITLDHNNEFSLSPVNEDEDEIDVYNSDDDDPELQEDLFDFEEAHSEWVRSLAMPSEQEVFEFLDILRDSAITNMFEAAPYIMKRFKVHTQQEASTLLLKWMNR